MKFVYLLLTALVLFAIFKTTKYQEPQKSENADTTEINSVVASGLDTPWSLAFLPSKNILVSERNGTLSEIDVSSGKRLVEIKIPQVKEVGEGGLLGLTLDPGFLKNNLIYLYYTYQEDKGQTLNRVSSFSYKEKQLSDEKIIIDQIPGASNHNGGRIKFGPDKNLYVTTGDAQVDPRAQDLSSLAGKILRVAGENVEVYSYGHRNSQGIAWDSDGQLWATEHGRSGALSGFDELNKIDQGKNYGWPEIQGDEKNDDMETSVVNSGAKTTWAPAGLAYYNGLLYFGGLRGSALYQYDIKTGKLTEHYKNEFGRIRDVVLGPDNMLYITTSNLDGRGTPKEGDDKIIRLEP